MFNHNSRQYSLNVYPTTVAAGMETSWLLGNRDRLVLETGVARYSAKRLQTWLAYVDRFRSEPTGEVRRAIDAVLARGGHTLVDEEEAVGA